MVWLHRSAPEFGLASPRDAGVETAGLSVVVDDVDAHYLRVKASAGLEHLLTLSTGEKITPRAGLLPVGAVGPEAGNPTARAVGIPLVHEGEEVKTPLG